MRLRLFGEVLGHEQQVFAHVQEHIHALGINVCLVPKHENAAITICVHRLIARLSPSELEAYVAHVSGKLTSFSLYGMSRWFSSVCEAHVLGWLYSCLSCSKECKDGNCQAKCQAVILHPDICRYRWRFEQIDHGLHAQHPDWT